MKSTKKSLALSVLSLVLCVAMLLGTTFAWFTDSVTSGKNKIEAGNLDVELVSAKKGTVDTNTSLFDDVSKWEPGVAVYDTLTVKNVGNLALKYQLNMIFDNETKVDGHGLSEVLKVGTYSGDAITDETKREDVIAAVNDWAPLATFSKSGNLAGGASDTATTYVIYWQPGDNDNLYNMNNEKKGNELSIDFYVKLVATQDTVEADSFNEFYDENAPYTLPLGVNAAAFGTNVLCSVGADGTVTYYANLNDALAAAPSVLYAKPNSTVTGNVHPSLKGSLTLYGNNADFNGLDIAIEEYASFTADTTLNIQDAKNIYVWGTRKTDKTFTLNINNCVNTLNGSAGRLYYVNAGSTGKNIVTITNCDFKNSESPIYGGNGGSLTVENCSFSNVQAALNINTKVGDMTTTVKNCNFVNCAANPDSAKNYNGVIRLVNTSNGTNNATVENCTFTGTALNGDILLGDTRDLSKPCYPITLTLKNTRANIQEFNTDFAVKQTVTTDTVINHLGFNGADWSKLADGLYKDADGNYLVSNANGFIGMREKLANGNIGVNDTVKLVADIDMTGKPWSTVKFHTDTVNKGFKEFNGQGHTISNMDINGQAMFYVATNHLVTVKNVTFDNAKSINKTAGREINHAIIASYLYSDLTLENVTVKNSEIKGSYKVAPLVATVYNDGKTTPITLTVKDCKVEDCIVTSTEYAYDACGMVAWVSTETNQHVVFEGNNTVKNVQIICPDDQYDMYAKIWHDGETAHDTDPNVTVTNVTVVNP